MNYPKCADKDEPRGSWPWESVLRCLSGQVRRCNHQPGRQRTDRIYSQSGRILLKVLKSPEPVVMSYPICMRKCKRNCELKHLS